jgi:hypothetical protein
VALVLVGLLCLARVTCRCCKAPALSIDDGTIASGGRRTDDRVGRIVESFSDGVGDDSVDDVSWTTTG